MELNLKKLKVAQAKACLSVSDLSEITGLGRVTVSKVLNGKVKANIKTIGLIAKALKIDVEEIID